MVVPRRHQEEVLAEGSRPPVEGSWLLLGKFHIVVVAAVLHGGDGDGDGGSSGCPFILHSFCSSRW